MSNKLIEYLTINNQIRDLSRIKCQNFDNSSIICGVIAISKNEKLLLVRGRKTGKWSLPKGHKEYHETLEECAKREFMEETGITINEFSRRNDIAKLRVGTYYFYEPESEIQLKPDDDSEITEAGWFSLSELRSNGMELNADANYIYRCLQKCWI